MLVGFEFVLSNSLLTALLNFFANGLSPRKNPMSFLTPGYALAYFLQVSRFRTDGLLVFHIHRAYRYREPLINIEAESIKAVLRFELPGRKQAGNAQIVSCSAHFALAFSKFHTWS